MITARMASNDIADETTQVTIEGTIPRSRGIGQKPLV